MMTDHEQTVGALLKQGRLKQRLTTSDCAKRTHISQRFIEALEEEQWSVLPSESHRLGFLKSYCRFLGLSADDVLLLYEKAIHPTIEQKNAATPHADATPTRKKEEQWTGWFPSSWPQAVLVGIAFLALSWGLYHSFNHAVPEPHTNTLIRLQSRPPRLIPPKNVTSIQRIRLTAQSDSWLRVTQQNKLLFEGILPAHATKEWAGQGPFRFRLANTKAVNLWWNDQPVDVQAGSHGTFNELQLPLPK